ncbi:MAG: amino acid--tRNA ligase-related protein, partial [Candidatus Aenigmatarchaeota archaeon]
LFETDYFGDKAYLSQSGQLYLEALIYSLEKVYALTPSFRAEKSRTRRHVMEYWHLEPEAAWVKHEENMEIQEKLLSHACQTIASKHGKELEDLGRSPEMLKKVKPPFDRMSYDKALGILKESGFNLKWGEDFGIKEERYLTNDRETPLIVEKYPLEAKAFYMKEDENNPKVVMCNDVLAPEGFGEIVGASERETKNQVLIDRLNKEGANLDNYGWYLDLRKYGSVPHSGFGVGVERVLRWICDLDHIRDTLPFPRTLNRYYP